MAQALTRKVLERGYRPFVVIRPENDASRSLYMKLGFTKAYETIRAILTPHLKDTLSNGKVMSQEIENGIVLDSLSIREDEGIADIREIYPNDPPATCDDVRDEGIGEETKIE